MLSINVPKKLNTFSKSIDNYQCEINNVTPPKSFYLDHENKEHSQRGKQQIQSIFKKIPKLRDLFKVHKQIGEGTFSTVYVASLLHNNRDDHNQLFAIKHLIPTVHPQRIQVELICLKLIGGQDNVVGMNLCIRDCENTVLIMPYLKHDHFTEYFTKMDAKETAIYLKNLLKALRRVHSFNIIHRDIKPSNFLYNRQNQKFLLVDFGLAQVCSSSLYNFKDNKRKSIEKEKDCIGPISKRQALLNVNMNLLSSTIYHLQKSLKSKLNKSDDCKENTNVFVTSDLTITNGYNKCDLIAPTNIVNEHNLPQINSQFQEKLHGQKRIPINNDGNTVFHYQTVNSPIKATSNSPDKNISQNQRNKNATFKSQTEQCECFNKPIVCSLCLLRKMPNAARAGTPGFRPPEVLLKFVNQTVAVDIWAVGVIMLCILSRTYPFFRATDDITALAEIITIFGDEKIRTVANKLGRHLICSEKRPPLDLRKLCSKLRSRGLQKCHCDRRCVQCSQFIQNCLCITNTSNYEDDIFPDSAYDLLKRLLDVNPFTRITAEEALKHPFLSI